MRTHDLDSSQRFILGIRLDSLVHIGVQLFWHRNHARAGLFSDHASFPVVVCHVPERMIRLLHPWLESHQIETILLHPLVVATVESFPPSVEYADEPDGHRPSVRLLHMGSALPLAWLISLVWAKHADRPV